MPTCFELGNCDIAAKPLETILLPFTHLIGDFLYPAFWGTILFIIWLKTHDSTFTGLVGVIISTAFIGGGVTLLPEALYIGIMLLGVSVGISLYRLLTERLFK